MSYKARHAYRENEVMADPIELVRMLHRGGVDALGKARQGLRDGDIAGRSRQITRASEILNELTASLDMEAGGELSQRLLDLYDYMQRQLHEANFHQVEEPLVEVEGLLMTLLQGWEGVGAGSLSMDISLAGEGVGVGLRSGISA
ncbi:MAG: flagellar export chaperone FliS [Bryobacteraceae bacterium]